MTALPPDIMEAEADIYLVFTGWDAGTTAAMSVDELMRWHAIAIKRHEKSKENIGQGHGG